MTSLMKWVFASLFVISAAAAHIRLTRGSVAYSRARSQCCSCCALRGSVRTHSNLPRPRKDPFRC